MSQPPVHRELLKPTPKTSGLTGAGAAYNGYGGNQKVSKKKEKGSSLLRNATYRHPGEPLSGITVKDSSNNISKHPSESKQISFANTVMDNNVGDFERFGRDLQPRLLPTEISIDERKELKNFGGFSIPEMPYNGQFIRQGYEPIKSYDLKNVELPNVLDYVATSIESAKKENDMSYLTKTFGRQQTVTANQCFSACADKGCVCNKTVRIDDSKADERLKVDQRGHVEDLLEKFKSKQKATEAVADAVLHILGVGNTESTPKSGGVQDLQNVTLPTFGQLLGNGLKHMRSSQAGQLTGIMEIKEDGIQEDQSSDLVSLDDASPLKDRSMQIDLKKRDRFLGNSKLRSSSLKPADLRAIGHKRNEVDAFLDINMGSAELKNTKTSRLTKKQSSGGLPYVTRFLNSTSPTLDKQAAATRQKSLRQQKSPSKVSDMSGGVSLDSDATGSKRQANTIWNRSSRENLKRASQDLIKNRDKNDPLSDIESLGFKKLMQLLCPPNENFCGCELPFVDTVFFDRAIGKASEMINTSKEGFIQSIKAEKRLKFLQIQSHFTEIARERRRTQASAQREIYEEERNYDRQMTLNMRTTFASEFNSSEFKHTVSGMTNDMADVKRMVAQITREKSMLDRERSMTDTVGFQRTGVSFNGGARSTMSVAAKSTTKKSSTSQATKRQEKTAMMDLAVFRFEVDPTTVPINMNQTSLQDQTSIFNETQGTISDLGNLTPGTQAQETMGTAYVKVVNEPQFLKMMGEKASSRQWRALECVQSCIKAQRGLGKHIPIKFNMQLDYQRLREIKKAINTGDKKYETEKTLGLDYDFLKIGEDYRKDFIAESKTSHRKYTNFELNQMVETKLKFLRPKDYCLRLVLKICYYMQRIHEMEILQMNADFFQDDNGEVWFAYANDILYKPQVKCQHEIEQEEAIKDAYKTKQQQKNETDRLEYTEWKDYQKKLRHEEQKRRNVFKEQLSKLSTMKIQRKLKKQEKADRTKKVKDIGKQIGLGEEDMDTDQGENMLRPVLSQREVKIKKYAESFQRYFMKMRKEQRIDSALMTSDSELDDALEDQVDEMIDNCEAKEKADRRAASKLRTRGTTGSKERPMQRILNNIEKREQMRNQQNLFQFSQENDYVETDKNGRVGLSRMSQLNKQILKDRMRSMRHDHVIDDVKKQQLRYQSRGSNRSNPLDKYYMSAQILDGGRKWAGDLTSKGDQQPSTSLNAGSLQHQETTTASFIRTIEQTRQTTTRIDGYGVDDPYTKACYLEPLTDRQKYGTHTPYEGKSTEGTLRVGGEDQNHQQLTDYSLSVTNRAPALSQQHISMAKTFLTSRPIPQNFQNLNKNQQLTILRNKQKAKAGERMPNSRDHNLNLPEHSQTTTATASQIAIRKSFEKKKALRPVQGIGAKPLVSEMKKVPKVGQVQLKQCAELVAGRKPHDPRSSAQLQYSGSFGQPPQTADSSKRIVMARELASQRNNGESFASLSQTKHSWQIQHGSISSNEIRQLPPNAYFNIDQRMANKGRQKLLEKATFYKRSVSPGKTNVPPHKSYMRSIDKHDQERTHFFHMPESQATFSTNRSTTLNQSGKATVRRQKRADTTKKGSVIITHVTKMKKRGLNSGPRSTNQQFSTDRTTLLSRYPIPQQQQSNVTLSTNQQTQDDAGHENSVQTILIALN